MKILHVVFSNGQLEKLTKFIESWSNIDYGNHEVTKLLVEIGNPEIRNESIFEMLGKVHNSLLWRNPTQNEFENWVRAQNYDYVIRQESVISEPLRVDAPDKQY